MSAGTDPSQGAYVCLGCMHLHWFICNYGSISRYLSLLSSSTAIVIAFNLFSEKFSTHQLTITWNLLRNVAQGKLIQMKGSMRCYQLVTIVRRLSCQTEIKSWQIFFSHESTSIQAISHSQSIGHKQFPSKNRKAKANFMRRRDFGAYWVSLFAYFD